MQRIEVNLARNGYIIEVGTGFLTGDGPDRVDFGRWLKGRTCLVITDDNVAPLYSEKLRRRLKDGGAERVELITFPAGEGSKTLATVTGFYGEMVKRGCDRKTLILALGGGVCGDMAGFCAATYMRGVDYIQIPTTLLAQVDSSVGGKTGVDLPEGKNLVGAFKQPLHVWIDVATLSTLPVRELRSGLAEVVKYGVIMDRDFFAYLEQHAEALSALEWPVVNHVVSHCCRLKARVVMEDEEDRSGRRAILNYGHTFGHALEKVGGFARFTHGEAVAVGMMMAAELCVRRDPQRFSSLLNRQENLWQRLNLPRYAEGFDPGQVLAAMRSDKKYENGRTCLVLPRELGCCAVEYDVPESEIVEAIRARCR